jgi:hypothetical protein
MKELPDAEQQQIIDDFICGSQRLLAVRAYREVLGGSQNDAVERMAGRQAYLRNQFPERFPPPPDHRAEAFQRLALAGKPLVLLEGWWDEDSFSFYLTLDAIIGQPSREHPRYTAHRLTTFEGTPEAFGHDAATLGRELAMSVGVPFFLNEERADTRWWDRQP